jgi:hypothetical protein
MDSIGISGNEIVVIFHHHPACGVLGVRLVYPIFKIGKALRFGGCHVLELEHAFSVRFKIEQPQVHHDAPRRGFD